MWTKNEAERKKEMLQVLEKLAYGICPCFKCEACPLFIGDIGEFKLDTSKDTIVCLKTIANTNLEKIRNRDQAMEEDSELKKTAHFVASCVPDGEIR